MTFIQKFQLKQIKHGGNDVSPSPNNGYAIRTDGAHPNLAYTKLRIPAKR